MSQFGGETQAHEEDTVQRVEMVVKKKKVRGCDQVTAPSGDQDQGEEGFKHRSHQRYELGSRWGVWRVCLRGGRVGETSGT